jgi:N6-adenosine-specific RNA methylase IME4
MNLQLIPRLGSEAGWHLPANLTEPEWWRIGAELARAEKILLWRIGEWWNAYRPEWGSRGRLAKSEAWKEAGLPDYATVRQAAAVAKAFDIDRRRSNLTFSHHVEVAALPAEEADALLDAAEAEGWSKRELRGEVSKRRNAIAIAAPVASDATCTVADLGALAASGARFGCIYADPPWLYDNQGTRAATGNHYGGMTVEELCALPVGDLAADDAHLHLWTTNAFLFECPRIFAAWGFKFRSSFVWVKPQMGIGNYWRNSHEILLTAIRGDAKRFNDRSLRSWLECDRGVHSAKPEQVRRMLERASPGPRLEMFGRQVAEGWTVWGNQIERGLFAAALETVAAAVPADRLGLAVT